MSSTPSAVPPNFEQRARELSAPLLRYFTRQVGDAAIAEDLRQPAHRLKMIAGDEAVDVADPGTAVNDILLIDEMNSCVRGVIDSLPPDYRTAPILHDLEGMNAEQTAAVSQCSLATAKIRIHRARQRLKTALARECDFYRDSDSVFRCTRS